MCKTRNILITGHPGVGKTTVIRETARLLSKFHPRGFYTKEIRVSGVRRGFQLIDLEEGRFTLAHVDFAGGHRVGKYGVDIKSFEDYLRSQDFGQTAGQLVIIDEIGKMECFSELFVRTVVKVLDSDKAVIATISEKGGGIIQMIKARRDVHLIEVGVRNRDSMAERIAEMIRDYQTG
jgi:nucleoside-triphosphatase